MKNHEIRELVNQLRDIAVEYRDTQQLREHIAHAVSAAIKPGTLTNKDTKQAQSRIDEAVELLKRAAPQMLAKKDPDGALVGQIKSNSPVIPDGWKLVPIEPTEKMLTASYMFSHVDNTIDSWKAMLAAAPHPDTNDE